MCIYDLLFKIETVVQMNSKVVKACYTISKAVQYIRLQIFNMDLMHTQFIYNYLIGSY